MSRDWEEVFRDWAKPPSATEQERAENAVRAIGNAVSKSDKLQKLRLKIFVHGSYRNHVNVRHDSDVDIGVMCYDYCFVDYPPGKTAKDFGHRDADYSFRQFKDDLEDALVDYFGRSAVSRGNKTLSVHENTYRVAADVTPFFEYRGYVGDSACLCGVALLPDSGRRIVNFPERLLDSWPKIGQHYENGVEKNTATARAFKGVVRILKKLRNEMEEAGIGAAKKVPGFLLECLAWNVPNDYFGYPTWDERVQNVLRYLWSKTLDDNTCNAWTEVNGIKALFHPGQKWTRAQAHAFIDEAWSYIGVR